MLVGFENFSIRVYKFWVDFLKFKIYYLCKYNQINKILRDTTLECFIVGEMKGNWLFQYDEYLMTKR
jgi:hypothetical protein